MPDRKVRHLRPLQPWPGPGPPPTSKPPTDEAGPATRQVSVACDECRRGKAKCSGHRPTCRRCVTRGLSCNYTAKPGETNRKALGRKYRDLQNQAAADNELLQLLRELPHDKAQCILRTLRSGADVVDILNHVQAGDALLQMAVEPEACFRYEFPYRADLPWELGQRDSPYLASLVFDPSRRSGSQHSVVNPEGPEYRSRYVKPFHAGQVVDTVLSDAKPSAWTSVSDNDVLMRHLLADFFRCEYQFTAAFQKDLFLEDMASGKSDFCSSLLVNLVLAYACICYQPLENRAEYWNPHTLTYRFFSEARRLWDLDAATPRLTTIQAGMLFSVFYNLSGLDEIGQPYRIQGIALAQEIGLFDPEPEFDSSPTANRLRRGKVFTAWALYNWETLVAFSFMKPPALTKPPSWRLPDPELDADWYGETWVKYPLDQKLCPLNIGHVIRERCRFRIIMNDFCETAYANPEGPGVTPDKANELRLRLQAWYDDLPDLLTPKAIVLPKHLQMHIYYHHLLLSIYEPLVDNNETDDSHPTPQQVVATAQQNLQILVRLYYLRHGLDAMDLFIVIPLMLVAYNCLDAIDSLDSSPSPSNLPTAQLEPLRSTLLLVAKGLASQRRNHYLAEALYLVVRGRMRPEETVLLGAVVGEEAEAESRRAGMVQGVRSSWPVSVVKKREDVPKHILGKLVERYDTGG